MSERKPIGLTVPYRKEQPEQEQLMRDQINYGMSVTQGGKRIDPMSIYKEPEQEPVAWRNAAIRVGEDLCSVGPLGYYDMTAEQWLDWALSVVTVHAPPPQLNDKLEAMAVECERMPFGDTGASFAAWIRGHKL